MKRNKKYVCGAFIIDALMFILTVGLWIIWVFAREMRRR